MAGFVPLDLKRLEVLNVSAIRAGMTDDHGTIIQRLGEIQSMGGTFVSAYALASFVSREGLEFEVETDHLGPREAAPILLARTALAAAARGSVFDLEATFRLATTEASLNSLSILISLTAKALLGSDEEDSAPDEECAVAIAG